MSIVNIAGQAVNGSFETVASAIHDFDHDNRAYDLVNGNMLLIY